jgi:hypothetical protein
MNGFVGRPISAVTFRRIAKVDNDFAADRVSLDQRALCGRQWNIKDSVCVISIDEEGNGNTNRDLRDADRISMLPRNCSVEIECDLT